MKPGFTKRAYTLVEVMIASSLSLVVMVGVFQLFLQYQNTLKPAQAQVMFNTNARYGVHYLTRIIQHAKMVEVNEDDNSMNAVDPDGTTHELVFDDGDGKEETVKDNVIRSGDRVLVRYVSHTRDADGEKMPIFRFATIDNTKPDGTIEKVDTNAVIIQFHVGDASGTAGLLVSNRFTGPGYQGNAVRETVSPRNFTPPSWDKFNSN